ncbi:hypothetical protein TSAR_009104 [Trichomalopsis sarcophagae]|uniref:Uncharacterized protein n=1 Tax=Trichomalopsis sarcophagae TaxID=543379 RepID=A0A232EYD0_9HYME|nr:hypothetical protein TSAR_009104 [Trichomalopsis sarcophagae]
MNLAEVIKRLLFSQNFNLKYFYSHNQKDSGLAVGESTLYIRRYFDNSTRQDVRDIIHLIADEFQNYINKVSF